MTAGPLYQADAHWSGLTLGKGPSTIGKSGCLLVCLTMAAREFGVRPTLLPPHANLLCLEAGAFDGDALIVHLAAAALDLDAPLAERIVAPVGSGALIDAVSDALVGGALAILHVDHDSTRPSGDADADHFILAYQIKGDRVLCYDPAVGRVQLTWPGLQSAGDVVWGPKDFRRYRVMAVRPIRKAASH